MNLLKRIAQAINPDENFPELPFPIGARAWLMGYWGMGPGNDKRKVVITGIPDSIHREIRHVGQYGQWTCPITDLRAIKKRTAQDLSDSDFPASMLPGTEHFTPDYVQIVRSGKVTTNDRTVYKLAGFANETEANAWVHRFHKLALREEFDQRDYTGASATVNNNFGNLTVWVFIAK